MNDERNKPRVVDIALQAGVSTATVDRVLNGRSGVRAKTVQKVRDAEDWLMKGGGRPMVVAPKPLGLKMDVLLSGGPGFANEILMREFIRAGRDMGVSLNKKFIPRASAVELKAAVEESARGASDGLIFQPIEHRLVRDAVMELAESGFPVVCALTTLPGVETLGYSGLDNRAAGRAAGLLLGHLLGRRGKVAILMSDALYRSHEERESGARNILRSEFPEISTLESITTMDNPDACYRAVLQLLEEHPDIGGICNLGGGNRGIEKALIETGRAKDIAYIAFNLTPLTRKALLDGTIDAVIHQDMGKIARTAIEAVCQYHNGSRKPIGYIPTEIIMRENIRDIDFDKPLS